MKQHNYAAGRGRHIICCTLLTAVLILGCACVLKNGVFGSKVDWISQHSVLPDYFRQLFYETGNLFPNFAPDIGGGQNIYNFSYYGLFSPLILLSYAPAVRENGRLHYGSQHNRACGLCISVLCLAYKTGVLGLDRL